MSKWKPMLYVRTDIPVESGDSVGMVQRDDGGWNISVVKGGVTSNFKRPTLEQAKRDADHLYDFGFLPTGPDERSAAERSGGVS